MNKSLLCAGAAPNTGHGPPNVNMDLSNNLLGLGNVAGGRYNFFVETKLHGTAGGRTTPVPASFAAR